MNRTKGTKYAMKMHVADFFPLMNNSSYSSIHENKSSAHKNPFKKLIPQMAEHRENQLLF